MLYLEQVALESPYIEDLSSCQVRVLKGSVSSETIQGVVSRAGIYHLVVELRAPDEENPKGKGTLIAVVKAYAIQWTEVEDEIAEMMAGWGGADEVDFKEALSEVNPSLREMGQLFTRNGRIRQISLTEKIPCAEPNVWRQRAPLCAKEDKSQQLKNIALMDYILVSRNNRGRGVGKMLVEVLKQNLQERFSTTHILSFPTALNVQKMEFKGLGSNPEEDARWIREHNSSMRFHREQGFRRLFGTKFFCFTYDDNHEARKMTIAEDEMRDASAGLMKL